MGMSQIENFWPHSDLDISPWTLKSILFLPIIPLGNILSKIGFSEILFTNKQAKTQTDRS